MSLSTHSYVFEEPEEQSDRIILPAGKEFPFVILEINDMKDSSTGNPMIPVKMEFDGGDHGKSIVYEKLVFVETMKWKINQFLKCVAGDGIKAGKKVNFEDPEFIGWLKRQTGKATLKIEDVKGKTYQRNSVDSYSYEGSSKEVEKSSMPESSMPESSSADEVDDDDIPF